MLPVSDELLKPSQSRRREIAYIGYYRQDTLLRILERMDECIPGACRGLLRKLDALHLRSGELLGKGLLFRSVRSGEFTLCLPVLKSQLPVFVVVPLRGF